MPFDTIDEIKKVISNAEDNMTELVQRWDDDFDLLTLVEYDAKKGYESYTSPSPRNFHKKILDGLNRAAVTIQIKMPEGANENDRENASLGELFIHGGLNAADRLLTKRGEPTLRRGIAHFASIRGWFAVRSLVYVPKDRSETIFDIMYWDPMHVTWEYGSEGLLWAAHKTMITAAQASEEYGWDSGGKDVEKIDFWDTENNSVILGGEWGKEPEPHNIDHVPVLIGSVGSMPTMQPGRFASSSTLDLSSSMMEFRGESVWDSSRGIYEPFNKYVSSVMDMAKKALVGSLLHFTKDGKGKIEGDPHETFQIFPMKIGDSLVPIESPAAPAEVAALLRAIGGDLQQSTLPDPLAYGGTESAESGRALTIRLEATRSVFNPFTEALATVYTWVCEEMLSQFSNKGIKPTLMRGFNIDNEFFQVTVKPNEVDKDWFVSVRVEPRLPRDEEIEIATASAATARQSPDEQPLMSKRTAREDILRMRDPDAEEGRILTEMGLSMPPIVATRVASALNEAGKPELAEQILRMSEGAGGGPAGPTGPDGAPPAGPIPEIPILVEALIRAFTTAGFPQIAEALVGVLQGSENGAQPTEVPGPPPGPPMGPPTGPPMGPPPGPPMGPPIGPPGPVPQATAGPPPPSGPLPPTSDLVDTLREIETALVTPDGAQDMGLTELIAMVENGQQLPPNMVESMVSQLISIGRQDLARDLLTALGVSIP
jgi:hypothetical protein